MGGSLSAVVDAELVQDRVDVIVYRALTDEKRSRDRGIAVADGDELENLALSPGQVMRIRAGIGAVPVLAPAPQGGETLARTVDGCAGAQLSKREQCRFHGGNVTAELRDGRVIG
jgi:hypothetical protein